MKRFILLPLLLSSCLQGMPPKDIHDRELKEFKLEDSYISPIKPEPISRYDQDICEIIWDKELRDEEDCPVIVTTPPPSPSSK